MSLCLVSLCLTLRRPDQRHGLRHEFRGHRARCVGEAILSHVRERPASL